jgi:competence protein ComEA
MPFRSAILAAALLAQSELPDGPAKQKVVKICATCHELETVVASRRTKFGWQQMTEDMVSRGAEGSEDDLAAVVSYLTEWAGKINVNTASAVELQKALGIEGKEAGAIVSYREQNGKYKGFEELLKTPGIDSGKLREKRALVAFSQ